MSKMDGDKNNYQYYQFQFGSIKPRNVEHVTRISKKDLLRFIECLVNKEFSVDSWSPLE